MTYFEVTKDAIGTLDAKRLGPKDILSGKVNGNFQLVEVLGDDAVYKPGQGVVIGPKGAVVFDKPHWYSTRKAVVYLNNQGEGTLENARRDAEGLELPGLYQSVLQGLYRLGFEQAGLRQVGKRSLMERLEASLTSGATEVF